MLGLDANTYKTHSADYQGVAEFHDFLTGRGLASCWGDRPDVLAPTTFNARTFLQPQVCVWESVCVCLCVCVCVCARAS